MPRNSPYTVTLSQSKPILHRPTMMHEALPSIQPWYESRMGGVNQENLLKYFIVKSPFGAPDLAKITETDTGVTLAIARHPQPMPVVERLLLEAYTSHIHTLTSLSKQFDSIAQRFENASTFFSAADWTQSWRAADQAIYDKDRIARETFSLQETHYIIADLALIAGIDDVPAWYEGIQQRAREIALAVAKD